jgi:glycine cleavage system regulatory protein
VRSLVLINSVGGASFSRSPQRDRPFWEYSWELAREFWSDGGLRIMEAVQEDVVGNMLRNPRALAEIGVLAARADLTAELAELRRRELPILVLGSNRDGLIPTASFDSLCAAIGTEGKVLDGGHSWLLANPRALGAVVDNLVSVEEAKADSARATTEELRSLLAGTKVPKARVKRLLAGASPLWLMSDSSAVLAHDLALCHPALAPGEVRAVVRPMESAGSYRLTVVAGDRPGLLADTAAAIAAEGLSIEAAAASTWVDDGLALHSMTVAAGEPVSDDRWAALGERLRSMSTVGRRRSLYVPTGRANVTVSGEGTGGALVKVTAPDGLGLLEAICRWFADYEVTINAAKVTTRGRTAVDTFLVDGAFNPSLLAHVLSRPRHRARWDPLRPCRLNVVRR